MATLNSPQGSPEGPTSSHSRTREDESNDSPPVVESDVINTNEVGSVVEPSEQQLDECPIKGEEASAGEQSDTPPPPYSVFRRWQIWCIVVLTSCAALFSPLSANIYFPAIPVIATAFNQSIENINVTVTVYMLLQGTAPMVWGSLADWHNCVGLALTPTSDYWLLVLLRCLQAAGSASSVAISIGTIMDIAEPSERGTMVAMASIGTLVTPSIGPVIGGVLAGNLGWRSIFWFLCIFSGSVMILEVVFLPETLRAITGDGSIPAQRWNRPFIPILMSGANYEGKSPDPSRASNPLEIFKCYRNIDLVLLLWSIAVPYAGLYCILTTMSPTFLAVMPSLTEIDLGLCYLATGVGGIAGSLCGGRLVDWDFRRAKKLALLKKGIGSEEAAQMVANARGGAKYEGIDNVERTRLRLSPIYWSIYVIILIGYGWAIEQRVHIACLLVLQFLAMFQLTAIFTSTQTLLMDLFPGRGASVSASNNLVRCLTAAVLVSIVDFIINAVGYGWTFTILGTWCIVTYPLLILEMAWGWKWRERRSEREKKEQEKSERMSSS
ncbi:MFS general substrate transporter [Dacryopinax primogenitus]|uniref:MFS general substrate transporter n=1 Tax=Dacryopinax primogenitus (strain DJM 731) TaxID=1858805 RepID=M5FTY6_DACPD|nr:MFS general substrate transporter [Dacryopinax primogenitus]EJT99613.1 MFS general substrate transporter [Dacryopinax primogenitus]